MVKHLSAVQETWVRFLDWEGPLEKEMAAHSSILAWKIPWTAEPSRLWGPWGHKESDMTEQLHFHFVSKLMSLFFNMLSRLFIAFIPRSKCL